MRRTLPFTAAMMLSIACCPDPSTCPKTVCPSCDRPAQQVEKADKLCPPKPFPEHVHPQGRLIRGGCLEMFQHFYISNDTDDSAKFVLDIGQRGPIKGYHYMLKRDVELKVRRDKVETSIKDARGKEIAALPFYQVTATTDEGELDLCTGEIVRDDLGAEAAGTAVAIPGYWRLADAIYLKTTDHRERAFMLACAPRAEAKPPAANRGSWPGRSGVAGKCVTWGYVPWAKYPEGSDETLEGYFKACVSAARAQYGRDGEAFTCSSTEIDIIDKLGIKSKDPGAPAGFALEAAWGEDGLICMDRPRYKACAGAPAVQKARSCTTPPGPERVTSAGLAGSLHPSFDEPAQWPRDVLIINRSSGENVALSSSAACPSDPRVCE